MKRYSVEQSASGVVLGTYEGNTPEEAIRNMCIDAGYPDGVVPEEIGGADTLVATEIKDA